MIHTPQGNRNTMNEQLLGSCMNISYDAFTAIFWSCIDRFKRFTCSIVRKANTSERTVFFDLGNVRSQQRATLKCSLAAFSNSVQVFFFPFHNLLEHSSSFSGVNCNDCKFSPKRIKQHEGPWQISLFRSETWSRNQE